MADSPETALPCSLHKTHSPSILTVELHHVIPQAWQRFFVPPGQTPKGSLGLWDARTVPICPTGHRNVHMLIVKLMRWIAANPTEATDSTMVYIAAEFCKPRGHQTEFDCARLALERFAAAGGTLLSLTAVGQFGEA